MKSNVPKALLQRLPPGFSVPRSERKGNSGNNRNRGKGCYEHEGFSLVHIALQSKVSCTGG